MIVCVLLWALLGFISWSAIQTKGATLDEREHALVGWFAFHQHDYRLYDSNPVLWEYWIALPTSGDAVRFEASAPAYQHILPGPLGRFTKYVDYAQLLERGRRMSLCLSVLLAMLITLWSWQLAGPLAAVVATFFFCLDPNIIGHAALVKNDIACSLFYAGAAYMLWLCGRRLNYMRVVLLAIFTAGAMLMKFSGLVIAPVLVLVLVIRAMSRAPWRILNHSISRRPIKLAAAMAASWLIFATTYSLIWFSYGFRFTAGPHGMTLSMRPYIDDMAAFDFERTTHHKASAEEIAAWRPPLSTRAILFAERNRLIPQAFAGGLLDTQWANFGDRQGFLLRHFYDGGKWYYFPLAAVFKEPLAMLVAAIGGLFICIRRWRSWAGVCFLFPAGAFAVTALMSQVNFGYRHIFPVLPFVFIAMGVASIKVFPLRAGRLALLVLGAALLAETAGAFPDYIAFFNVASAPRRLELLANSNLDWGQDLPLLAQWQHDHPGALLYLFYYGGDDPLDYGLRFIDLRNSSAVPPEPGREAVLAISATSLQFAKFNSATTDFLGVNISRPPIAILGGTIYLFPVAN